MFDGLNYISLYWLSGFGDPKYEIWEAKKATISRTPTSLSFSLYLAWPLEDADEGHVVIRQKEAALTAGNRLVPRRGVRAADLLFSRSSGSLFEGNL